jgi:hypothetical protein
MDSGVPELVLDGETGMVVADRREGFVAVVRKLAGSKELYTAVSEAAKNRIQKEYSCDVCHALWIKLLRIEPANSKDLVDLSPDANDSRYKALVFPVSHWKLPWSDPSMAHGHNLLKFLCGALAWTVYRSLPATLRKTIKKMAGSGN